MEQQNGKWRFTSPTHVVRAFAQALDELEAEGGIEARHRRYCENHALLVDGMTRLGFTPLLPPHLRSPIITAFESPKAPAYDFQRFYTALKAAGFVIYPGKVTSADTFRIGNIGNVYPADIQRLIAAVARPDSGIFNLRLVAGEAKNVQLIVPIHTTGAPEITLFTPLGQSAVFSNPVPHQ
jgi:2-aminoethylphosphonate-pyruvate transaminase